MNGLGSPPPFYGPGTTQTDPTRLSRRSQRRPPPLQFPNDFDDVQGPLQPLLTPLPVLLYSHEEGAARAAAVAPERVTHNPYPRAYKEAVRASERSWLEAAGNTFFPGKGGMSFLPYRSVIKVPLLPLPADAQGTVQLHFENLFFVQPGGNHSTVLSRVIFDCAKINICGVRSLSPLSAIVLCKKEEAPHIMAAMDHRLFFDVTVIWKSEDSPITDEFLRRLNDERIERGLCVLNGKPLKVRYSYRDHDFWRDHTPGSMW